VGSKAGLNVAQQLKSGQPFDYGQLARESALGAILNEPTRLGRAVQGIPHGTYEGIPTRAERIARNAQEYSGLPEGISPPEFSYQVQPQQEATKQPPLPKVELKAPEVRTPELVQADINKNTELMRQSLEQLSATKEPIHQEAVDAINARLDSLRTELKQAQQNVTQPKEAPRQFFGQGLGKGGYKYAEGEIPGAIPNQPLEQDIQNLLAKRGIRPGQYKISITDAKGNPILGKEGKPILGRATYPTRTVDLTTGAPKERGVPYHETGHVYFEDLARSGDARDTQLVQDILKEQGHPETVQEYVELNDRANQGDKAARLRLQEIEEPLMDRIGFEGQARATAKGLDKFKQYLKDYKSRFGLGENPAQQQFSARVEHEAPYGARTELTKGEQTYAANKVSQQGSLPREPQEGIGSGKENESGTSNRLLNKEEGGREGQEGGGQGQGHDVTGKNAEIESESLDKPRAYGHWISPSGEMIRVPSEQHSRVAAKLLEDKLGVQPENIQLPYTQLFEKGWLRGAHSGDHSYYIESKSPLNPKQIKALKDYGIERDTNIIAEVYGKDSRFKNSQNIYNRNEVPPDFGKSAEGEPNAKPSGRTPQIMNKSLI
jgi:hypothetical protein